MKPSFPATYQVDKGGRKIFVCLKHLKVITKEESGLDSKKLPAESKISCEMCTDERMAD